MLHMLATRRAAFKEIVHQICGLEKAQYWYDREEIKL